MAPKKDKLDAKALRSRLEKLELSQRAFAVLLDVSPITVNRWCADAERGDRLEIPKYVGLSLSALELQASAARG